METKIQFELKGADYETLIWNSPEDIKVKPFYHRDEFTKAPAVTTKASEFKICQNIFVFDIEKSVERALDTLERGADSLRFIEDDTIDIGSFRKLPLENVAVYFNFKFFSIDFVKTIDVIIQHKKAIAYYNMDPMGQLAETRVVYD
jgi:methylmalonyl-CoA mutase